MCSVTEHSLDFATLGVLVSDQSKRQRLLRFVDWGGNGQCSSESKERDAINSDQSAGVA